MKKIHKYQFRHTTVQTFRDIPFDAKILSIQPQGAEMCMWVEVDPGEKVGKMLAIITVLTGENAPDSRRAEYITTCQLGALVLHYYRLTV
ncbi:DUF7352 domain-containing protein [Geofilum rhodophaeum]|uniref:DUF7352 domain-containing protein n=1 Tax=Geofilum rhodophaeum TaxID=1965019 RepID=UPI000B5238BB|nr:hypothetical protein [Geofilum rhodophaeum]